MMNARMHISPSSTTTTTTTTTTILTIAYHPTSSHSQVVGDTIFNVLKMNELETDDQDRPLFPPKILSISILSNPFDDIQPRPEKIMMALQAKHKSSETDTERRIREAREKKGIK